MLLFLSSFNWTRIKTIILFYSIKSILISLSLPLFIRYKKAKIPTIAFFENNKTNLKHRHNIKPNHMNNSLSLISKTVFNNRFTRFFALIIRQIQRSLK